MTVSVEAYFWILSIVWLFQAGQEIAFLYGTQSFTTVLSKYRQC